MTQPLKMRKGPSRYQSHFIIVPNGRLAPAQPSNSLNRLANASGAGHSFGVMLTWRHTNVPLCQGRQREKIPQTEYPP